MMGFFGKHWWKILLLTFLLGIGIYFLGRGLSPKRDQPADGGTPPPTTSSEFSLITPYVKESDVSSINEAFSNSTESPWGFTHTGIDFMTKKDLVPFQAVVDGTITNFNYKQETNQQGWHYGFCIDHEGYLVCYNFETFSGANAIGPKQAANIPVKEGDVVSQGEIIGRLVHGGDGAHVDFGVSPPGGDRSCPEPYFTAGAKASILRLIHKDHPTWKMCY